MHIAVKSKSKLVAVKVSGLIGPGMGELSSGAINTELLAGGTTGLGKSRHTTLDGDGY